MDDVEALARYVHQLHRQLVDVLDELHRDRGNFYGELQPYLNTIGELADRFGRREKAG